MIRVIYDFSRTKDKQIFMAAFTEKDVAAGQPSDSTRLRVLINQATGVPPTKVQKPAAPVPPL